MFFVDDNFIGNKRKLKEELLPSLIEWTQERRHPFTFLTQTSINVVDDAKLVDLMVRSCFNTVFIGIETPDEKSLIECGKRHNTRRDLLENVKDLQKSGLQVQAGFILGFDSDKQDIFTRMSTFINESGIVTSMVGLLNAPTGTKLYKRLVRENRLLDKSSCNNTDFTMNFLPKMDYKVLIEGYKKLIGDIYRPEEYYKRFRTFFKYYRTQHTFKLQITRSHIRGFIMSAISLGIKPGVRKHYWKLLVWTLFRRPHLFPTAITLTIYGAHFMRHFDITV